MRIATWNINGVRARLDSATSWARDAAPDILCLQEIKAEDSVFPREAFEDLGYNVAVHGQKGFNGVAVLSKLPIDEATAGLPGDGSDEQARFLDVVVSVGGAALRVVSLYLPNGNPVESEKFPYKLAWMERLQAYVEARLAAEEMFVLGGDFNVILEPRDARFPQRWTKDALYQPESRAAFRRLCHLGLSDTFRACDNSDGVYTFWDYQAGAWQKDHGIRIDYLLASPRAADRLT
ncbi:MAG: exodeoxyribonuclease III, partial [Alphaproteobacteria bacterium]